MSSHMFCVHIGFEFSSKQAYCQVKVQVMIGSLTPAHPATHKYLEFYIQSSGSNLCIKYHNISCPSYTVEGARVSEAMPPCIGMQGLEVEDR